MGAELREGKGDHLEFKERSRRISGKALIQVRGVVLLVYISIYIYIYVYVDRVFLDYMKCVN